MKKNLIIAAAMVAAMYGAARAAGGELVGIDVQALKAESSQNNLVIRPEPIASEKSARHSGLVEICNDWIKGTQYGWADAGDAKLVAGELDRLIKNSVNRTELIQARVMLGRAADLAAVPAEVVADPALSKNFEGALKENIGEARQRFPELSGASDEAVVRFCRGYKDANSILDKVIMQNVLMCYDDIVDREQRAADSIKLSNIFKNKRGTVDARLAQVK